MIKYSNNIKNKINMKDKIKAWTTENESTDIIYWLLGSPQNA